jgi:predicted ArsR family transcriptional regulator
MTRHQILTFIKRHGSMTADELSRELGISQVAVRQHLASLEGENLVAVTVDRRGPGRPSHRYRLTPQGDEMFPRSYDRLLEALLTELRDWQGEEAVEALLDRLRANQLGALQRSLQHRSLTAKLHTIAGYQTDNGFMAEVIDDGSGVLRLVQHNCPACTVARVHPGVCCAGDLNALEELLGDVEIVHETHIVAGDPTCTFRVRQCNNRE